MIVISQAANPGCILEDFVRWYSPNDWLEGPETEAEKEKLEKLVKESSKGNNINHYDFHCKYSRNNRYSTWPEIR